MHGRHSLGFTPCADSLGDIITVYACFYYFYFYCSLSSHFFFPPLNSWCISITFRTILSWVSQFLIHVQSGLHVGAINATRGLGANAWLKCAPLFSGGVAPPNIACMHQWRCVGIPRAFVPPPPAPSTMPSLSPTKSSARTIIQIRTTLTSIPISIIAR